MERMILVTGQNCPPDVPPILHCAFNPSEIELTHDSGLADRPAPLFPNPADSVPALRSGGPAQTYLKLALLFQARAERQENGASGAAEDVRFQTRWLYQLAQGPGPGNDRPCEIDLIWGKSWAFRGAIRSLSERLDDFTSDGTALRAWIRLEIVGRSLTAQGRSAATPVEAAP